MSFSVHEAHFPALVRIAKAETADLASYKTIYEQNRHRVYSLAFWMTDNEITAEEISSRVFTRAFKANNATPEVLDQLLLAELRELTPIGFVTLKAENLTNTVVRGNTKRIHLERAVVQLPATERLAFLLHDVEGYSHDRVAATIGISMEESQHAVFQARVLIRELVAKM
jgi:RNA polymerase sigma-70 factor, ECF subfamily